MWFSFVRLGRSYNSVARGSHKAKKAVESQLEHIYASDHNETSRVVEICPPDGVTWCAIHQCPSSTLVLSEGH